MTGWPWLRTAEATRVINTLWADDLEAQRRRERNDQIYTEAIEAWFRRTEPVKETQER